MQQAILIETYRTCMYEKAEDVYEYARARLRYVTQFLINSNFMAILIT